MRSYAASLLKLGRQPQTRFVVFAQGRTGSTLLCDLLSSGGTIQCEKELLRHNVRYPSAYVDGLSRHSKRSTYGFKVKLYHLTDDQHMCPRHFLEKMHDHGWKLIYLYRQNLFRQVLSVLVRNHRKAAHYRPSTGPLVMPKLEVCTTDLARRIKRRRELLQAEAEILQDLPHTSLSYERNLRDTDEHQATVDRLCGYLGVAATPVRTKYARITGNDWRKIVVNAAEIESKLRSIGAAEFLDAAPEATPSHVARAA